MKGFGKKTTLGLCLGLAVLLTGCTGEHYRNLVDPCYYQRYSAQARQEVIQAYTPQVLNGRILDQTIWNYHFEPGTDKLHPSGMDKLNQIVRRRPQPDTQVFVATANDVTYKPDNADKFADTRRELNQKRVIAVQRYLAAATSDRPIAFDVQIHDPADPGIPAPAARLMIQRQLTNYTGSIGAAGGSLGGSSGGFGGGGMGGNISGGAPNQPGPQGPGTGSSTGGQPQQ